MLIASPAFGVTQDDITASALSRFNTASAGYSWDTQLNQYLNGAGTVPQYDGGLLAWGETYAVTAQRAMYEATGDTQYLNLLLNSAETMYANRADRLDPVLVDEHRNQTMPAFISFNLNQGANARQFAWLVHSAYPSHPVTNAIAAINNDDQLQAQYGGRAAAITADIVETMDSFDPDYRPLSDGKGAYYEPYLDFYASFTDGQAPYNMQNAAGLTYIGLWKATGEQRFYDRAEALAKTMKAELTPVGDRYQWRYAPYNSTASTSDISHAGLDVSFMVDAYEAGIVIDDTDIQRLANTMRHIEKAPGFTKNVDGSGAGLDAQIRLASLWLNLTRYDAALREEMFPVFDGFWDTASGLWPTLGSALLYETGQPYTQQLVFSDGFDRLQLDPRWRRPVDQPIGDRWTAQMTGGQLTVTDIQTTASGNQWTEILRRRDIEQDDSWEVTYDFSWDSSDGTSNANEAMQSFAVELHDAAGNLIANVGFNDQWNTQGGARVVELFDHSMIDAGGSLALTGSASVKITSDAVLGESNVYWDDILLLSVAQAADLDQVGMSFGHFGGPSVSSHFGSIAVDSLSVGETSAIFIADIDQDLDVDGDDFLAWQRGFDAAGELPNGDADGSGFVDGDDLTVWESQFGATAIASAVGIPEPRGFYFIIAGAVLLACGRSCIGRRQQTW